MKKFYFIVIIITLIMIVHSIYNNTFSFDDVKFTLPILVFFIYLIIKKK
jgi:hypothetical protein